MDSPDDNRAADLCQGLCPECNAVLLNLQIVALKQDQIWPLTLLPLLGWLAESVDPLMAKFLKGLDYCHYSCQWCMPLLPLCLTECHCLAVYCLTRLKVDLHSFHIFTLW